VNASRMVGGAVIVALVALGASAVRAWTAAVDTAEHRRYSAAASRAQELDARLDEEVARSRLGLVNHYDGIVRVWDLSRTTNVELARPPAFLTDDERAAIAREAAAHRRVTERKRELVEDFKTHLAVLRNSLRALPHNAERVLPSLREAPDGEPVARAVEGLVVYTALMTQAPSEARRVRASRRLREVDALAASAEPEIARAVELVVRHAQVVIERHAAVDAIVRAIMALEVSRHAARVARAYGRAHGAAERRADGWSIGVVACVALVLALGALFIIVRLRAERDREAQLATLKSRFVSMTSHEFRTPLSVILSSAELLEGYAQSWSAERRAKHVARIQTSAHAMTTMLDRVLLIGRAEAGMLELRPGPVRLDALVRTVVEEVRSMVGPERSLELSIDAEGREVSLDERLIRHVLINLLTNAFKYSDDDTTVTLTVHGGADGARLEVRDEGIGIPPQDRPRLFEAFQRGSNAEELPGTGLGLAVAARSVEAHGGMIEVQSEVGRGTTFTVRVPYLEGPS